MGTVLLELKPSEDLVLLIEKWVFLFVQAVPVKLKNGKEGKNENIRKIFYDSSNKPFIRGDNDMRTLYGQVS